MRHRNQKQNYFFFDSIPPAIQLRFEDDHIFDIPLSEDEIYLKYLDYKKERKETFLTFKNPDTKEVWLTNAFANSRFSECGKRKLASKIRKAFEPFKHEVGVFLTITHSPESNEKAAYLGLSRTKAWSMHTALLRGVLDMVVKERKFYHQSSFTNYFRVTRAQPNSLFPHSHLFFPGLKHLIDEKLLRRWWVWGNIHFEVITSQSACNYMVKYMTDTPINDFEDSMLFHHHTRSYSISRNLTPPPPEKKYSPFEWNSIGGREITLIALKELAQEGYLVSISLLHQVKPP